MQADHGWTFTVCPTEADEVSIPLASRPGPVMALAMDAHLNKEIFPVQVIA